MSEAVYGFPKPDKRWRNRKYLAMVAAEPCMFCGSRSGPPHHVRWASPCGGSQKPDDFLTVPCCPACHVSIHSMIGGRYEKVVSKFWREEIQAEIIRNMGKWIRGDQHGR